MKILLHCMPGYNPFLKGVIRSSKEKLERVEWSVLLYSNADNALKDYAALVADRNVFYLQDKLNRYMRDAKPEISGLKDFPASLFECIATSKVTGGHIPLARKDRDYQLKIVSGTYKIYKDFLEKNRPDFVFFPILELYDTVVLYHLCRQLKIGTIIYSHARNLGASYFSDSLYDTLPPYILKADMPDSAARKATDFILSFRDNFKKSFDINYRPGTDEIIRVPGIRRNIFEKGLSFVMKRLAALIGGGASEPHLVDGYTVFHRFRIHFLSVTLKYRQFKGRMAKRYFDIRDIKDLPAKFIYYPVQYTPEVSINVPAPFFVDQLRAIDTILGSMPPDHYLVVKEHPAMQGIRPRSFYRELRRKCNVLVADFSLPSIEITKKAALTVSVTGTACLEAFLFGKPSLHLGRTLFTDWLYKLDSFPRFGDTIREAIRSGDVPMGKIIDFVARVFMAGGDFVLFSPSDPYLKPELVMNKRNIDEFLKNLLKHAKLSINAK